MRNLRSCGFVVFRRQPETSFLLMQHPTRWDLPKGHVDGPETDMQCALRELHEETGIVESALQIDPHFRCELDYEVRIKRNGFRPTRKTLIVFLGWLTQDCDIVPTEHEGYRWIAWNPPHRIQEQTIDPVLNQVEEHLSNHGQV